MDRELITVKDYGHIEVEIRKYMDAMNLKRGTLARRLNTRYEVINKWYDGKVERIDTDILARMCYVLEREPGDIIIYKKPQIEQDA